MTLRQRRKKVMSGRKERIMPKGCEKTIHSFSIPATTMTAMMMRDLAPDPEPRKRPLSSSIRSFGNGSGGVVMSKRDKVNYLVGKGRKELDEGDIVTDELRWEGFTKYFFPS